MASTDDKSSNGGQIWKIPIKVAIIILLYVMFGTITSYYTVLSYIGAFQTSLPSNDPDKYGEYFKPIKLAHLTKNLNKMPKKMDAPATTGATTGGSPKAEDAASDMCNKLMFDETLINETFKDSFLYQMNYYKPTEYENFGMGIITYPIINFIQRVVILNYKLLDTYFGFINSISSEKTVVAIGFLFGLLFIPLFLIWNFIASIGCWWWSLKDFFKVPGANYIKQQMGLGSSPMPTTAAEATGAAASAATLAMADPNAAMASVDNMQAKAINVKKNLDMGFLGVVYRLCILCIYFFCGFFTVPTVAFVAGTYTLFNSLVVPSSLNASSTSISPSNTFSSLLNNNLTFYRHIYFIAFAIVLTLSAFSDINSNAGVGIMIAIIGIAFGTSMYKQYTPQTNLPYSGAQCIDTSVTAATTNKK